MIKAFKTDEIKIKRYEQGRYVRGKFIEEGFKIIKVKANVQPMQPTELINLPESQRTKEGIKIYTDEILKTADEDKMTKADLVEWQDKEYEIHQIYDWSHSFLPYFKATAIKKDKT